jgi:hypothetical protein
MPVACIKKHVGIGLDSHPELPQKVGLLGSMGLEIIRVHDLSYATNSFQIRILQMKVLGVKRKENTGKASLIKYLKHMSQRLHFIFDEPWAEIYDSIINPFRPPGMVYILPIKVSVHVTRCRYLILKRASGTLPLSDKSHPAMSND